MWKNVDTVAYYIHDDFKFFPTIAIFSFVGTIVKKAIPLTETPKLDYLYDMKIIKEKIKSITDKGASIILYDSFKTELIDDVKQAIDLFQIEMDCPMSSFISTKSNKYSKPFTGIWKIIELLYKKESKIINKSISMIIGNKAGRMTIESRKIDKGCCDRAFAKNTGLNFTTPERFFLGNTKFVLWEWNNKILDMVNRELCVTSTNLLNTPILIDEINKLPNSTKYTVIVTGTPSCGKSTFAHKIKRKWDCDFNKGVIEIATDNSSTIEELEKRMVSVLTNNQSIIVDLTCFTENVTRVVKKSMENLTPILIIEIKTNSKISQLLDFIKVQTSKTPNTIVLTTREWDQYYKQYIRPEYNSVPCVRHIDFPLVIKLSAEFWFEYSP
jgi:DNA 3'-phosphatase